MDKASVLVIEDVAQLRNFIVGTLEKAGYAVEAAGSASAGHAALRTGMFDLVLLDLKLGDGNGLDILRAVRRHETDLPVIIVSSLEDLSTKVESFDLGCDDYVTKPFYAEELLARMRRILKRTAGRPRARLPQSDIVASGPFTLNTGAMTVRKGGVDIPMRRKLFELFHIFACHPDTVLSAAALESFGWAVEGGDNSLYVYVRLLRSLVEDDPDRPCFITTVRRSGYRYSPGATTYPSSN